MTAKAATTASRKGFCRRFIVRSFVATIGDEVSWSSGPSALEWVDGGQRIVKCVVISSAAGIGSNLL
jgi:hypothetical protein